MKTEITLESFFSSVTEIQQPCKVDQPKRHVHSSIQVFVDSITEEDDDKVTCRICGKKMKSLINHLVRIHKMNTTEYRAQYGNDAPTVCKNLSNFLSQQVKGDKNPAYQHGGKYSPFSKKFVKYKDLDETEINEKINDVYSKIDDAMTPEKRNTRIEYYLAKGMSQEEAKKALKERQATFSLDSCIENFGKEEGTLIWQERQDKWLAAYYDKTDEELTEINLKKMKSSGSKSKVEYDIAKFLVDEGFDIKHQFVIKYDQRKRFIYDIQYKNKIIEYNGDYWHANPVIFNESNFKGFNGKTIKNIRERDELKIKTAKDAGYDVLVIWENDYINDKTGVLNQCKQFLMA